jgi:hypothetical protein
MPYLEEVFRLSGIPTYTFVQPDRYDEIKVSVRTPGRCLVLEGPSGIGKTTTITKVLGDLGISAHVVSLSARNQSDLEYIVELPNLGDLGTVIVDDFHRLDDATKARLSDFMKVLADNENPSSKLILIGINKAGQQLVKFAHDLGLRIDVFKLETNSDEQIEKLISLGEGALNVGLPDTPAIARHAQGSFQIAQLLCHKLCVLGGILDTCTARNSITTSLNVAIEDVMTDLARQFKEAATTFARGSKIRREGRAPYLHILHWLSETDEWSIDLTEAVNLYPDMKGSVGQVIDKGYLEALLADPEKHDVLSPYFHYEPSTTVLSVEDPKLVFYLKNVIWRVFTRQVGYRADYFKGRYDFALSFAGPNRDLAKTLHELLTEREVACFYDENEQHRILAQNIEDYIAPIYRSEARYVVVLQSPDYPKRIWTKFESDNFSERFGTGSVIPIRYTTVSPGHFNEEAKYGGLAFDPTGDLRAQAQQIAATLCKRIIEDKQSARDAEDAESIEDSRQQSMLRMFVSHHAP